MIKSMFAEEPTRTRAVHEDLTTHHLSDDELLLRFADAESRSYAFQLIVQKYQKKVYTIVRKMLIDHEDTNDVTQDTFVKVWKYLPDFRRQSALYTWIYRIATNECLQFLQKKKRRFLLPIHNYEKELAQKIDEQIPYSSENIQNLLQKAILTLPEKQRVVFTMRYYEECSFRDLSEILDTSEGALKASYHHAAKKIEAYVRSHAPNV